MSMSGLSASAFHDSLDRSVDQQALDQYDFVESADARGFR